MNVRLNVGINIDWKLKGLKRGGDRFVTGESGGRIGERLRLWPSHSVRW